MDVQSSAISRVEHDPQTHTLTITFKSGATYEYPMVPRKVFEDFATAASKGEYFARNIRPNFTGRKV